MPVKAMPFKVQFVLIKYNQQFACVMIIIKKSKYLLNKYV